MSAKAGKNSVDISTHRSPREFHFERVICLDSKPCSKGEILLKNVRNNHEIDTEILVKLDFSFFKPTLHDFLLKSSHKRNRNNRDVQLYVEWSKDGKIDYQEWEHEKQSGFKLVLPDRTIAGEVDHALCNFQEKCKIEASLWLDKARSPNKRTHFILHTETKSAHLPYTFTFETSFSHPALSKKLSVKGKSTMSENKAGKPLLEASGEIDIFNDPSQVINLHYKATQQEDKNKGTQTGISVLTIKSNGCHLDISLEDRVTISKTSITYIEKFSYVDSAGVRRESIGKFEMNPSKLYILLKFPTFTVLEANIKMESKDTQYQIVGNYDLGGTKYKEKLVITTVPRLKYQLTTSKITGEKVLEVLASGEKNGEVVVSFDKANILSLNVDLSKDKFLDYKYTSNPEHIKKFYKAALEEYKHLGVVYNKGFGEAAEKTAKELDFTLRNLINALPNFEPMMDSYLGQLESIKNELLTDANLGECFDHLKETLSKVLEHTVIWVEELTKFWGSLFASLRETADKLQFVVQKSLPELTKAFQKISELILSVAEEVVNITVQCADYIVEQLKEHEENFKAIFDACSSYLHDFSTELIKFWKDTYESLKEFCATLEEQLKEFPIYDLVQEHLEGLKNLEFPDEVMFVIQEAIDTVKPHLPTQELTKLVETCGKYIEKLRSKEQIDIKEALKDIYQHIVAALKSLSSLYEDEVEQGAAALIPSKVASIAPLKYRPGGVRVSLLKWLANTDFPSAEEFIRTYFQPSVNPLDHIPPYENLGVLIGGTEIITFDGRHLSFKGTCSYVLAERYGIFRITAHVENGKLKSITVADEHDTIELRHNQNVLVNGQPSEYPVQQGQMKAWRRPQLVGFWSKAGVLITCRADCNACAFQISGFYFNKLQGLFGNGNYEPYDDLTLPVGKVTEDVAEFVNSWKVDGSCPAAASTTPHDHAKQDICTRFFENDENLMFGELTVDPKAYRDSCDHLVAMATTPESKKAIACTVAIGYAWVCREKGNLLVEIPETCVTCTIGEEKVHYGDTRNVETGKSADVVFVIEQLKHNEELVKSMVPSLVPALKNDFKEKGINDVYFGLVGFGNPKNNWPTYFTTHGKIIYSGSVDNVVFNEEEHLSNKTTLVNDIRRGVNELKKQLGLTPRGDAYWDILEAFNFRPESVKVVIGIHANPCEFAPLAVIKSSLGFASYKVSDIHMSYVTPNTVSVDGHESECTVGYDSEHFYTLNDAKQKPLKGKEYHNMKQDLDYCTTLSTMFGGDVFSGGNFLGEKPPQRKQFAGVMSHKIVQTATDHHDSLTCECTTYRSLLPHTRCLTRDYEQQVKSTGFVKKHRKA